eukprot:Sspe_Gene.99234::Locus_72677_Transcript_1_1_Confidence_1.000_Length_1941::g.99234::m.99234/K08815/TTBK; tau tubulin kinase
MENGHGEKQNGDAGVKAKEDAKRNAGPFVPEGAVIKARWTIANKLGQGSFGETYVGQERDDRSKTVAIKVEKVMAQNKDALRLEVMALKKLQICPAVVRYISSGKDERYGVNYLVMERLGENLAELKKKAHNQTFEYTTVIKLGLQMLSAIEGVHKLYYVHRDIKPSNFVIGMGEKANRIYLIDFGLARRYATDEGHRKPREKAGFRGTVRYASINAHKYMELGRRDDLWCLFYVIIEFIRGLPWRKLKEKDVIGEKKIEHTCETGIVNGLDVCFTLFMKHLFTLDYESTPDYEYLRSLLHQIAESENVDPNHVFEWQRPGWHGAHVPSAQPAPENNPPPNLAMSPMPMDVNNAQPANPTLTPNNAASNSSHSPSKRETPHEIEHAKDGSEAPRSEKRPQRSPPARPKTPPIPSPKNQKLPTSPKNQNHPPQSLQLPSSPIKDPQAKYRVPPKETTTTPNGSIKGSNPVARGRLASPTNQQQSTSPERRFSASQTPVTTPRKTQGRTAQRTDLKSVQPLPKKHNKSGSAKHECCVIM